MRHSDNTTAFEAIAIGLVAILTFFGIMLIAGALIALRLLMWAVMVMGLAWLAPGVWTSVVTAIGQPTLEPWVGGVIIGIVVLIFNSVTTSKA